MKNEIFAHNDCIILVVLGPFLSGEIVEKLPKIYSMRVA